MNASNSSSFFCARLSILASMSTRRRRSQATEAADQGADENELAETGSDNLTDELHDDDDDTPTSDEITNSTGDNPDVVHFGDDAQPEQPHPEDASDDEDLDSTVEDNHANRTQNLTTGEDESNPDADAPPPAANAPFSIPTQLRTMVKNNYRILEGDVEKHFKAFFEFVQNDMPHNARLLFVVGVCAGGALGQSVCAWAIGFGLSAFHVEHLSVVLALVSTVMFVDCALNTLNHALLGYFQLGCTSYRVMERRFMDPYAASGLTLGMVACLSPSYWLSMWILAIHWYSAFPLVVR